ncbi:hypothetical protein CCS92_34410 [Methylobacterium radiotolerans]|nr:hypothetical protein CCS92_34410 [Methylobacterium radiotolerans]
MACAWRGVGAGCARRRILAATDEGARRGGPERPAETQPSRAGSAGRAAAGAAPWGVCRDRWGGGAAR